MNLLDVILLLIIAGTVLNGWRLGFVMQVARFVSVILGFIIAFRFSADLAAGMKQLFSPASGTDSSSWFTFFSMDVLVYRLLAFALLFFFTVFIVRVIARVINRVVRLPVLNSLNRLAGLLLAILQAGIIVIIVIHVLQLLPGPKMQSLLEGSLVASWVMAHTPTLTDLLKDWLQVSKT